MSADRRFTLALGMALVTLSGNPSEGAAQSCEALPVDGSPLSYRFRANAPRCEGMYRSPVAGEPGMTLVSLTVGKVAYDARTDQYLEIRLPAEVADRTSLRAVGIPERLYYRLDVELGPGRTVFRLPLRDVIAPENIASDALGIYGERPLAGRQKGFVPVHARPPGGPVQDDVVAVVRPGSDVSDVRWRRYAPGVAPLAWAPIAGASGLVPAGARLEIMLGRDVAPQTTLEVSFLSQGVPRADRFVVLTR